MTISELSMHNRYVTTEIFNKINNTSDSLDSLREWVIQLSNQNTELQKRIKVLESQ